MFRPQRPLAMIEALNKVPKMANVIMETKLTKKRARFKWNPEL